MADQKYLKYFVFNDKKNLRLPSYRVPVDPKFIRRMTHVDKDIVPGAKFYNEVMCVEQERVQDGDHRRAVAGSKVALGGPEPDDAVRSAQPLVVGIGIGAGASRREDGKQSDGERCVKSFHDGLLWQCVFWRPDGDALAVGLFQNDPRGCHGGPL